MQYASIYKINTSRQCIWNTRKIFHSQRFLIVNYQGHFSCHFPCTSTYNFSSSFHDGGRCHIETSPLIFVANQWTGFYMITASVMKELRYTKKVFLCKRRFYKCKESVIFIPKFYKWKESSKFLTWWYWCVIWLPRGLRFLAYCFEKLFWQMFSIRQAQKTAVLLKIISCIAVKSVLWCAIAALTKNQIIENKI